MAEHPHPGRVAGDAIGQDVAGEDAVEQEANVGLPDIDELVVEQRLGAIEAIEERVANVIRGDDDEAMTRQAFHDGMRSPSGASVAVRVENERVLACARCCVSTSGRGLGDASLGHRRSPPRSPRPPQQVRPRRSRGR